MYMYIDKYKYTGRKEHTCMYFLVPPEPLDGPVAFTAFAYDATYTEPGTTITFNGTATNLGNAFDAASGVFTCPITGYYLFYASIMSNYFTFFFADLYRNDEYVVTVYSNADDQRQSPNMAAIQCNTGDSVMLLKSRPGQQTLEGFALSKTTTFSGYLLGPVVPEGN